MTIKHISFDVWNTLITANPAYAEARTRVISNVAEVSLDNAALAYKHAKDFLDSQAERGMCGDSNDAWYTLGEVLRCNKFQAESMKFFAEMEFLHHRPTFDAYLARELTLLSHDYALSIKSNTNFISGKVLAKACEFEDLDCFDFMHFSDAFRLCKPDVLFFAQTLLSQEDNDLCPDEILHVGDNLICDGKCVDFGMQFCYVSSPQDLLNKLKQGALINA